MAETVKVELTKSQVLLLNAAMRSATLEGRFVELFAPTMRTLDDALHALTWEPRAEKRDIPVHPIAEEFDAEEPLRLELQQSAAADARDARRIARLNKA